MPVLNISSRFEVLESYKNSPILSTNLASPRSSVLSPRQGGGNFGILGFLGPIAGLSLHSATDSSLVSLFRLHLTFIDLPPPVLELSIRRLCSRKAYHLRRSGFPLHRKHFCVSCLLVELLI